MSSHLPSSFELHTPFVTITFGRGARWGAAAAPGPLLPRARARPVKLAVPASCSGDRPTCAREERKPEGYHPRAGRCGRDAASPSDVARQYHAASWREAKRHAPGRHWTARQGSARRDPRKTSWRPIQRRAVIVSAPVFHLAVVERDACPDLAYLARIMCEEGKLLEGSCNRICRPSKDGAKRISYGFGNYNASDAQYVKRRPRIRASYLTIIVIDLTGWLC